MIISQAPVNISMSEKSLHHDSLGLLLRLTYQQWTLAVDTRLAEEGFGDIRPHHANVFTFVPPEGIQVAELTKLAHMRKQSMTQIVEEMEKLCYVERRPDPNDKRARLVFLTERGKGVKPVAIAAGQGVDALWSERTSPEEIEALRTSLKSILTRLEEKTPTDQR
jgi:DNA-binding MarR family transcriptional regulator